MSCFNLQNHASVLLRQYCFQEQLILFGANVNIDNRNACVSSFEKILFPLELYI